MRVEEARSIVAKQLLANAARDIDWEDIPDIGEDDWNAITIILCDGLAPNQPRFDPAIELLMSRVEIGDTDDAV